MRVFLWTLEGGMKDLGSLGGRKCRALAVNSGGQVVGHSQTADGPSRAFSWTFEDGMVNLGTLGGSLSSAVAVSDSGHVVGSSTMTGDVGTHATMWR